MNSIRPLRPLTCLQPGEGGSGGDMADLPEWDFSALYAGQDDPKIASDLNWLAEEAKRFRADYEGQLSDKTAIALGTCIQRYEGMQSVMGRIMSFAGLRYYQNTTDANRAKFMSDMQDRITMISSDLVFFSLEMNRIEDERFDLLVSQDETLTRYKPVLDRMRAMKPYQLSDELETFLHDQSVVGAAAWNRLFDETMAGLEFDVEGEKLSLEATLNLLSDPDRARRETATHALIAVFRHHLPLFSRITNTLAKDKEIEDRWRKLPTPQASRHLANHVEPEVEALRDEIGRAHV